MIGKALLALGLVFASSAVTAQNSQADRYQEGVHYFRIDQVPTNTGDGLVEVTEIFSYGCSHCNTFEPFVQSWKERQPAHVKLTRIPVTFGRNQWEMMARGYIAAEMMGIVEESHIAMMDAIWKERKQFRSVDQLADFYTQFGVKKDSFLANFNSFAADSQMRKGQRDVQLFGITGTPSVVVNRKYRIVSSKVVNSFDEILNVVDFLVARESAALAATES